MPEIDVRGFLDMRTAGMSGEMSMPTGGGGEFAVPDGENGEPANVLGDLLENA
jgi:hypothetical protein